MTDLKRLLLRAGWAPVAVVVLHAVIGLDPVMHLLGGAAIAYFLWHAVLTWKDWFGNPRPLARALIVFCMSTTVTVFWEFMEFSGLFIYSQISLKETMGDLVLGCLGAGLYVGISSAVIRMKGGARTEN